MFYYSFTVLKHVLSTTNGPSIRPGSGIQREQKTTGAHDRETEMWLPTSTAKENKLCSSQIMSLQSPGSGSPEYRKQTGCNWIECLKKSCPVKGQNHWERAPHPESLQPTPAFSPKSQKSSTSARGPRQPLSYQGSIWAETQWAFGWRNRAGSGACPCSAHFVMSCGEVRKIKTDGRTSRWSR